jgi:hypothetical protein
MGKKPAKRGSKPQSKLNPPPDPSADALIEPSVLRIAGLLKSGRLTAEEMAKPIAGTGWPRMPPELRPFIESPTLPRLAEVLRARPGLYWHPLVERQIAYLRRLRYDVKEWERLGWEPEWNDTYSFARAPRQVATVSEALRSIVEAHAGGLFPRRRIVWKDHSRKPGRKGRLNNPHPTGESWTEWIEPVWLAEDFRYLHAAFKARLRQPEAKPYLRAEAKEWHRRVAQEILQLVSETDGVGWWSGWKDHEVEEMTADPAQSRVSPEPSDDALFSEPPIIIVERWKPLDLDDALDKMLRREPASLAKEGKPAYLAYAVLGALVGKDPDALKAIIDNYRYPRRRRRTR